MTPTVKDILQALAAEIAANIGIFNNYFYNVRAFDELGVVEGDNQFKPVGCEDNYGNYFYLRINPAISTVPAPSKSDCAIAVSERYTCYLVAHVLTENADQMALKDALLNEALKLKLVVKNQNVDPITILIQELAGLEKEVLESAFSRLGTRTMCKIEFEFQRGFETHSCAYNICKNC